MFVLLQYDAIIEKADSLVKKTVVLHHYYTVSLARFKHACQKVSETSDEEQSLEDCIVAMKLNVTDAMVKASIAKHSCFTLFLLFFFFGFCNVTPKVRVI